MVAKTSTKPRVKRKKGDFPLDSKSLTVILLLKFLGVLCLILYSSHKTARLVRCIEHDDTSMHNLLSCWDINDRNGMGTIIRDLDRSNPWTKYPLTKGHQQFGASCLDGTVPNTYYIDGFNDESAKIDGRSKYFINLEGGGWCAGLTEQISYGLETCYSRSQKGHGSSLRDPPYKIMNGEYLFRNPKQNKLLYNWNGIYVRYCDGSSFSGNVKDPIESLYFRGNAVLYSVIVSILDRIKDKSDSAFIPSDIIITGSSAGGLSTYLHSDFIIDTFITLANESPYNLNIQLSDLNTGGIPLSGFFTEYNDDTAKFVDGMKWIYNTQNLKDTLNKDCLSHYGTKNGWKCLFPQNMGKFLKTKMFGIQSQYDTWQLKKILYNENDDTLVNEFGKQLISNYENSILDTNSQSGVFLDSCYRHGGHWDTIFISNINSVKAMYEWWYDKKQGKKYVWIQNSEYPCDNCCT